MAQLPLPPVPNTPLVEKNPTADAIWKRWLEQLRTRLILPGQIEHNNLEGLQGGTTDEYYHLTSSQHGAITSIPQNRLLGRGASSGTGAAEAITLGTNLSLSGTTLNATGGGSDLKIVYNNENLEIDTNTQVTGHASLTFTGTGNLIINGTGSLAIL
jgi:hypothetical protein